jgi:hypothetical protein
MPNKCTGPSERIEVSGLVLGDSIWSYREGFTRSTVCFDAISHCQISRESNQMRNFLLLKLSIFTLAVLVATNLAAESEDHDDHHDDHEMEEIVVQTTRSRRRLQDEPTRVEVLNQEEIEEKILMRPGNISMLLA